MTPFDPIRIADTEAKDGRLPADAGTALSSPTAIEPASQSRPSGLQSAGADGWTVGLITTNAKSREDGWVTRHAAGWVKGLFGLDFRPVIPSYFETATEEASAWVLTHLPTGWGIKAIRGTIAEAKAVSEIFGAMGDWNFSDPANAKEKFGAKVADLLASTGGRLFSPSETIPPWHPLTSGVATLASVDTHPETERGA